jgi:hypothetical protein
MDTLDLVAHSSYRENPRMRTESVNLLRPASPTGGFARATALTLRRWLQVGFVYFVLGVAAWIAKDFVDKNSWTAHGVWCAFSITFSALVLVSAMRRGVALALRDHLVMFLAAFSLYFLFGAALPSFGPEWQIARSLRYYPVDAVTAMRIDAINATSFGIALMIAAISPRRWFFRQTDRVAAKARNVSPSMVMLMLMLIGSFASMYTLSVDLGLREGVISGIWRTAGKLSLVGIYLGSSYHGRFERGLRLLAILMSMVEVFGGLLMFNKSQFLLPLACVFAGLSQRYHKRWILAAGVILVGFLYIALGGVMSYGRNTLEQYDATKLSDRWIILNAGLEASEAGEASTRYNTWGRLCYLPAQAAALDFYDSGSGSSDLNLLAWTLVPRVLAPTKPIMTQSGVELNIKISGQETSSSAPGIFLDGYYNGGWPGVLLVSIVCGWMLAQTSSVANAILSRHALLLLPFALLGVLLAFRVDGFFMSDYVGSFAFLIYGILMPALLLFFVRRSRTLDAV